MVDTRPQPSATISLRMYVLVVIAVRKYPVTWNTDFSGGLTDRGYTMHSLSRICGKHLDDFRLINMLVLPKQCTGGPVRPKRSEGGNGRIGVYPDYFGNPLLSRFLSPDNYIQAPGNPQNYNRYSYALNNPLVYTDPSGEFFWAALPVMIKIGIGVGAAIGGYTGYKIGEANGASGLGMLGYVLGGAAIGGVSGYLGGTVAAGGGILANTSGIMLSSYANSMGMAALSGARMDPSMSFGAASYDFGSNEWGYLGEPGNSKLENIGYGFGALGNLQDLVSLINGGGQNIDVNSASTKDGDEWWGHSSITYESVQNGKTKVNTLVSVGPETGVENAASLRKTWQNSIKVADVEWSTYFGKKDTWSLKLNNISTNAINKYASNITRWDLLFNSCVGHATRALWRAGVPTVYAFHPHMLNLQLLIRQLRIYSNPYIQYNKQ